MHDVCRLSLMLNQNLFKPFTFSRSCGNKSFRNCCVVSKKKPKTRSELSEHKLRDSKGETPGQFTEQLSVTFTQMTERNYLLEKKKILHRNETALVCVCVC